MKNKEKSPSRSNKKKKSNPKTQITQHFLEEILRNIENIQTTILNKLDRTSDRQKVPQTPKTPKKQSSTPKSCSTYKTNTYLSERCQTSKENIKTPPKVKMVQSRSPFLTINPSPLREDVLKQLNKTEIVQIYPATIKYGSNNKQKQQKRRENMKIEVNYIKTARQKQMENKQNHYSQTKTQRKTDNNTKNSEIILKNNIDRHHISRQKYDIQHLDQNNTIKQPPSSSRPQSEIEKYYRRQIQRLQVQSRIHQLQEQLQDCLINKQASKPAQFTFLRAKMKKISLQLVHLKSQRQALRQ